MALLLIGGMLFGSTAVADDTATGAGNGTLIIQAVDGGGSAVTGALVRVFNSGSSTLVATGNTGFGGKISFSLPGGDYTVVASSFVFFGPWAFGIFGVGNFTLQSGGIGGGQVVMDQFLY